MSRGKRRPIRRNDGAEYASASDAARVIIAEQGAGKVSTVAPDICHAADSGWREAYGYRWEWIDGK